MNSSEPKSESASSQFANWRAYAAAAGATLAMTGNADASVVYANFAGQFGASASGAITATIGARGMSYFGESFRAGSRGFRIGSAHALAVRLRIEYSAGKVAGAYARLRRYYGYSTGSGQSKGPHVYFMNGKLSAGQTVKTHNTTRDRYFPLWVKTANGHSGSFGPGTVSGFLGFRLIGSNTHGSGFMDDLGWLRIKVSDPDKTGFASEVQVIDYAYNDTGGPIFAGQTTDAVPEPGTAALALLACGAGGLLAWRKRRSEDSANLRDSRARIGPNEKRHGIDLR